MEYECEFCGAAALYYLAARSHATRPEAQEDGLYACRQHLDEAWDRLNGRFPSRGIFIKRANKRLES